LNILITGAAGFIGQNYLRKALETREDYFRVIDKLTYSSDFNSMLFLTSKYSKVQFIQGDIQDTALISKHIDWAEVVINFAAESHVDRSIASGSEFIESNVLGAQNIFEIISKSSNKRLIHISTDEVYGSIQKGSSRETDNLMPNSPYSASKAAADLIARSYNVTFGSDIVITRSCNNFGPYQFPEKLIPLAITKLLSGKRVPIYGDGSNVREWIFVDENNRAIDFIISEGKKGEVYNIGSGVVLSNLEVVMKLIKLMNLSDNLIEFVSDRKGHDKRYCLNSQKLHSIGFRVESTFDLDLERTISWYSKNIDWWSERL
jgi:dTDP-glucose 4,6-dehydratase